MGKRRRSASQSPISPPPLTRNQTLRPRPSKAAGDENPEIEQRFEVLSWNVNGVSEFLTPSSNAPLITSYFRPPPSASRAPALKHQNLDPELELHGRDSTAGGSSLRQTLKRHAWPQVVCLQEVKINPQDARTRIALERAANREKGDDGGPAYTAHFSLPRDKYNAAAFGGKVYGVCTLVQTTLLAHSKTRAADWDVEGRVLVTEFARWRIVVLNSYWVNGTRSAHRSPETGAVVGTRHERKRGFHAQMLGEVKALEGAGWRVVLVGDMNVAPAPLDGYPGIRLGMEHIRSRRDFNEKFLSAADNSVDEDEGEGGMRGIDTFRHFHGGLRKYTYHGEPAERWGESCDRVDLGIVSRSLVEGCRGAVVGAEIWESVEKRGASDHVPISIVLDVGKLEVDEAYDE